MSIRARLLMLVLLTAIVPALLMGWRYYLDRDKEIETAISGLAETARAVAANLDAKIQGTAQLHFGLARARNLSALDKQACSAFLAAVLEKNRQFTGMLTIDPDGGLVCDSLRTGRVLDLRDRDYFQRAINLSDTIVIEPVFGRLTGLAVLQIAYPVRDEAHQLQFVLLASLDLDKFIEEQTRNLPEGFEVLLADIEGKALVWTPTARRSERSGTIIDRDLFRITSAAGGMNEVNADGETQVWSSADTRHVGGVSLHVMVGRSKSELIAGPNRRLAEEMAVLILVLVLLIAVVWIFAEISVRSQLARISAMAKSLGEGNLAARVLSPHPRGELGGLMKVLNTSAASLQRQRDDIESLNQKLEQSKRLEMLEKHRLDIALDNMTQGLVLFDASQRIVVCNQRYIDMFGVSPDVAKPGCSFRELIEHRRQTGSFKGDVEAFCSTAEQAIALNEISKVAVDTGGRLMEVVSRRLADGGWVATHEDITESARARERIAHLAHYDALTDLPNRVLFGEQLDRAMDRVSAGEHLAVLYIDIDEFKKINDSLGHAVGDALLKGVADRLRGCIDEADFIARLGGDEFAVIQAAVDQRDKTYLVARIYQAIREPYDCLGHILVTDASIGIALAPQDGVDRERLLKNADLAMYAAKADGRRTYRFFEPGMEERVKALRLLELDLRLAVTDGKFELHYQPVLNIADGRITGCEALLRWNHPQRGMVSPAEFIPVAEETGLINQLGEWVLNKACTEAASWPNGIKVAVNVSPIQFRSQSLPLKVCAALAASGLPAHRLELEITEAVLIRDDESALAILHQLRDLGVRIALDDFGTGYSSLSYLQRFPFDKIKIDRSFIKDIEEAGGSACIVQAVLNIAAARNMTTTAEGVETEAQLEVLRKLGCTEMQGYLFSSAKSAPDIKRLLLGSSRAIAAA